MNLDDCRVLVNEYIAITKKSLGDSQNLDELRDVMVKHRQLIRTLFLDSSERINDINEAMALAVKREQERGSAKEQAKVILRYLNSLNEEIVLRKKSEETEAGLIKIKKGAEEKRLEAKRREAVTETKFYGAAIEMIDRLRDELKKKDNLSQDVVFIKQELSELKEMISYLTKEIRGESKTLLGDSPGV